MINASCPVLGFLMASIILLSFARPGLMSGFLGAFVAPPVRPGGGLNPRRTLIALVWLPRIPATLSRLLLGSNAFPSPPVHENANLHCSPSSAWSASDSYPLSELLFCWLAWYPCSCRGVPPCRQLSLSKGGFCHVGKSLSSRVF